MTASRRRRPCVVSPSHVAVADDGTLYISDTGNGRIRRVAPNGVMTTVAGGGDPGSLGDGGPATNASLSRPRGIALAKDGTLYVADTGHDRVRRITPDGGIATAAGGGAPADGLGDGGPGPAAALDHPYDVAVDAQGVLYVADGLHYRIRTVKSDGVISTLAGNGQPGSSGDGGAAKSAQIGEPQGLSSAPDGTVYFADRLHHVVRKVTTDGFIARVAGTGSSGYQGDSGPPLQAKLSFPQDVSVAKDGSPADRRRRKLRESAGDAGWAARVHRCRHHDSLRRGGDSTSSTRTVGICGPSTPSRATSATSSGTTRRVGSRRSRTSTATSRKSSRNTSGVATAIIAPGGQRTVLTMTAAG